MPLYVFMVSLRVLVQSCHKHERKTEQRRHLIPVGQKPAAARAPGPADPRRIRPVRTFLSLLKSRPMRFPLCFASVRDAGLDHEQIHIAVRSHLLTCRRAKEDDPIRLRHRLDARDNIVEEVSDSRHVSQPALM